MRKVLAIVLMVVMLASMMLLPVSASNTGKIWTDKTEYLEGEMVHVYFEFPAADTNRQIWVYKGEAVRENRVWVISATGTENHGLHPIFWHDTGTSMATPGDYTMVVMNKTTGEAYSPKLSSTFKIKANPGLTRTPTISLDKAVYSFDSIMTVSYDGITDALPYDKIIQITLYDSDDFPASSDPIYLWDTRNYIGINGTLEIDLSELDLWAGEFYAILESNDESMDLSYSKVDFTVADGQIAEEPSEMPSNEVESTEPAGENTPTPAPETTTAPQNEGGDNTLIVVVLVIAGVVIAALAAVVVILLKKKK